MTSVADLAANSRLEGAFRISAFLVHLRRSPFGVVLDSVA